MMTQSRAESTRDTYTYGQYINQSPPAEYDKSNMGIRTDPATGTNYRIPINFQTSANVLKCL